MSRLTSWIRTVVSLLVPQGPPTWGTVFNYSLDKTTPIKLMSYNVKGGDWSVGGYSQSVSERKVGIAKTIALKNPEIVCLQELDGISASTLASACASNGTRTYSYYQPSNNTNGIFWDSTLYEKISNGIVDITIPESEGGDEYPPRTAVWVKLKRKSDETSFIVISTHGDLNKPGQSVTNLMSALSDVISGTRTIIMGDLNANEARWVNIGQFKPYGFTNANTDYTDFLAAHKITGGDAGWADRVEGTAADNGLAATFPKDGSIIDWCYYKTGKFEKTVYEVVTTKVKWTYSSYQTLWQDKTITNNPSDHYPVYVELTFK